MKDDNQTHSLEEELAPFIQRVREDLERGVRPSDVANCLHSQGLGTIKVMFIFVKATGVSLQHVKSMGAWWGPDGVTEPEAFDVEARGYITQATEKTSASSKRAR